MIEISLTKVAPIFGTKNYDGSETPRRYSAPNVPPRETRTGEDYPSNSMSRRHYHPPEQPQKQYSSEKPTGRYNSKGQLVRDYRTSGENLDTLV